MQRRGAGGLPVVVVVAVVGEELVHRSIQQTYRQRSVSHGTQQVTEVRALRVSQGHERLALVVGVLSHDDPADQRQPGAQELVFGAAQTDALGAQPDGARRVGRGVRVGPDPEPAVVVGPAEQDIELRGRGRRAHLDRSGIHLAGPPVDRDDVPLAQLPPVGADAARDRIDPQRGRATHRGPAGTAGDHSRVRGEPSARRDDGVRGQQARYVRGRRLGHHQDGGHAVRGPLDRVDAGQRDPSAGRPGGGREPAHQQWLAAVQPQLWVQQCLYLLGSHGAHRGGAVHGVGGGQVHGEPYRGGWAGVVVRSRAEQGELAVAQLEPDVCHGVEVVLEGGQRLPQEIGATGEPRHRLARPARRLVAAHAAMEHPARRECAAVGVAAGRAPVPRTRPRADDQCLEMQRDRGAGRQRLGRAGPPPPWGAPPGQLRGGSERDLLGRVVRVWPAAQPLAHLQQCAQPFGWVGVVQDHAVDVVRGDAESALGDASHRSRPGLVQHLRAADRRAQRWGRVEAEPEARDHRRQARRWHRGARDEPYQHGPLALPDPPAGKRGQQLDRATGDGCVGQVAGT